MHMSLGEAREESAPSRRPRAGGPGDRVVDTTRGDDGRRHAGAPAGRGAPHDALEYIFKETCGGVMEDAPPWSLLTAAERQGGN